MSSEAHEPCAIKGELTPTLYSAGQFWKCRVCGDSYVMALQEIPVACPCCGVSYTQVFVDGEYSDPWRLRSQLNRYVREVNRECFGRKKP